MEIRRNSKLMPALALAALAVGALLFWRAQDPAAPKAAAPPSTPYGIVESIQGDTLTLKMQVPAITQTIFYTVRLASSTTVVRHLNKTPQEFAREMEAFRAGEDSASPIGYTTVAASRGDLAPGMTIEAPGAVRQGDVWFASQIVIDSL
ncbi:MAG: hypothetical protein AAB919_00515 [Patescibacteria group bacterium]